MTRQKNKTPTVELDDDKEADEVGFKMGYATLEGGRGKVGYDNGESATDLIERGKLRFREESSTGNKEFNLGTRNTFRRNQPRNRKKKQTNFDETSKHREKLQSDTYPKLSFRFKAQAGSRE
ncbi:hypothetical protein Tco_0512598 [Tanacetum coccineum]